MTARAEDPLVALAGDLVAAHRLAEHNIRRPDEPHGVERPPERALLDGALQAVANAALRRFRNHRGLRIGDRVRIHGGGRYDGAYAEVLALHADPPEASVSIIGDRRQLRRFLLASLELPALEALIAAYNVLAEAGGPVPDRAELELRARTRRT